MKLLKTLLIVLGIYFVIDKAKNFIGEAPIAPIANDKIATASNTETTTASNAPIAIKSTTVSYEERLDEMKEDKITDLRELMAERRRADSIRIHELDESCTDRTSPFRTDYYGDVWYDKHDGTYLMIPADGFEMRGHFDVKTGKVLDRKIKYVTQYDVRLEDNCTVVPEWGDRYVEKACGKKLIDDQIKRFDRCIFKNRLEGRNIYRIGVNTCGGGIARCDESMYW